MLKGDGDSGDNDVDDDKDDGEEKKDDKPAEGKNSALSTIE